MKCPCLSIAFRWKWSFAAFTILCKPFIADTPLIPLPFSRLTKTETWAWLRRSARKFPNWILRLFPFDFCCNTLTCHQWLWGEKVIRTTLPGRRWTTNQRRFFRVGSLLRPWRAAGTILPGRACLMTGNTEGGVILTPPSVLPGPVRD